MGLRDSLPAIFALLFTGPFAWAWSNHALPTSVAVSKFALVEKLGSSPAEPIDAFLKGERAGIARVLEEDEEWARANIPGYPARPQTLKWNPGDPASLRESFLRALRVNPGMKLPLFVQQIPGEKQSGAQLPIHDAMTLKGTPALAQPPFIALASGQSTLSSHILNSASDEPDFGLDVGLWEDSGTEFGKEYRFGKLPFGNPILEFATQAPFHMGFFHEAGIVYRAAPFLKRTYPELRIRQFASLARYAHRTGHEYWALRFAGWGLHYIQDLTQPYHARVLPGVSLVKMLWINTLSMLGMNGPKNDWVQLVTNRHFAIENYEFERMKRALAAPDAEPELRRALSEGTGGSSKFDFGQVRKLITAQSAEEADRLDEALLRALPSELVSNPKYLFGMSDPSVNVLQVVESRPLESRKPLQESLLRLMQDFGDSTRAYLRYIFES